eukprot:500509-Hanusia_phi.AAC.2
MTSPLMLRNQRCCPQLAEDSEQPVCWSPAVDAVACVVFEGAGFQQREPGAKRRGRKRKGGEGGECSRGSERERRGKERKGAEGAAEGKVKRWLPKFGTEPKIGERPEGIGEWQEGWVRTRGGEGERERGTGGREDDVIASFSPNSRDQVNRTACFKFPMSVTASACFASSMGMASMAKW